MTFVIQLYVLGKEMLMKKRGRPKSDKVKDHIVTVRLSDEEYLELKAFAEKYRQTLSEIIKSGIDLLYKTRR